MKFPNIAKLVKENRIKKDYSQADLCKLLGYMSAQYISNAERGICSIPLKKMYLLASSLEISQREVKEAMIKDFEQRIDGYIK